MTSEVRFKKDFVKAGQRNFASVGSYQHDTQEHIDLKASALAKSFGFGSSVEAISAALDLLQEAAEGRRKGLVMGLVDSNNQAHKVISYETPKAK